MGAVMLAWSRITEVFFRYTGKFTEKSYLFRLKKGLNGNSVPLSAKKAAFTGP
ncbi:hypothetical protein D3C73_1471850 [compost metagenome]